RVIAEFAASQAPAWSEKHGRSHGFREGQAWRREEHVKDSASTAIDWRDLQASMPKLASSCHIPEFVQ
ncbi:MAG: hypothetical protein L0I62_10925, partial [Gammaproteobacteria bacterium]|nr:hypothetical protein [Gammaproteobacteria bacterium]